jgi:hypothetical protein
MERIPHLSYDVKNGWSSLVSQTMPEISFWRDLAARFEELHEQPGNHLGAHWCSSPWNESGSHWHLDGEGNKTIRGTFRILAERAAAELGHADELSALSFWLNLLRNDSHRYSENGQSSGHSKDGVEITSQVGSIKLVCKASSEFCIKCEAREVSRNITAKDLVAAAPAASSQHFANTSHTHEEPVVSEATDLSTGVGSRTEDPLQLSFPTWTNDLSPFVSEIVGWAACPVIGAAMMEASNFPDAVLFESSEAARTWRARISNGGGYLDSDLAVVAAHEAASKDLSEAESHLQTLETAATLAQKTERAEGPQEAEIETARLSLAAVRDRWKTAAVKLPPRLTGWYRVVPIVAIDGLQNQQAGPAYGGGASKLRITEEAIDSYINLFSNAPPLCHIEQQETIFDRARHACLRNARFLSSEEECITRLDIALLEFDGLVTEVYAPASAENSRSPLRLLAAL